MKEDRISQLEDYIIEKERASIEELCSVFNVSKNTMRRDINQLEAHGKIKKVYGGIILRDKKTTEPFESREIKNKAAKLKIAELASTLIEDGDIVYIDSGTTTMHMIPYLSELRNVTIITNNLHVILNSLPYQNLNVISTGGTLFRRTNSFVEAGAVSSLKKYNISKAFLATTGVSIAKGITNSSSLEYDIKRYIVEHCDKKILLADNTKLGKVSLITYYDLKDIQVFISDQRPEQEYADFFTSNNITLLTPQ